ncbi:MAG TPA: aminotransferase class I/II-fold pyridoxal phosphate-dependent enzyme [Thermoanaerobaculia bacterium]|jgi:aromatic-L-amino-acid decarboxylase|nr:aminotransferase class I/II-fold pyridoxal phosphate-dependent enzyme [Thermoanaerobaculia bacterium]
MTDTPTRPANDVTSDGRDHPLELDTAAMRGLVEAALERIVAHISSLPRQSTSDTRGGMELARSLAEPLPETGSPLPELLDLLFDRAVKPTYNTASPGYLAYIPGGGLFQSAVADLIADSMNRYTSIVTTAPALARLEANVIDWFCEIAGYPKEARGTLTTGGSLANFTALFTARRERLPDDFLSCMIYASQEVHHSMAKGALLAGFPERNIRSIATDERFRLRVDALEAAIAEDRARGLTPFLIAASAGTTNTGAVDPLEELADLAEREQLWLHVDGAYGGFFLLTEEGKRTLRGIERADSIVLDPHKGLFLPYGTGAVLVRDGQALRRAHALTADYLPQMQSDPDLVDFCLYSPELSRPFRGLRVWLPFKMHGAQAFRDQLEEKLALTKLAADRIRGMKGMEILAEPQLSLFAFRLAPAGVDDPEILNRLNRSLLERVNARQRVFLTATMLGDRFALRICVLSFRTHRDRMEEGLEDLEAARREVLGEAST